MAKCKSCGKLWHCTTEDQRGDDWFLSDIAWNDKRYVHCKKCRCPECERKIDEMLVNFHGKMS